MGDDLPDYQLGISILAQALASLQAEVTQLATVNVDVVSQSIANLTAVVSATALDIRALVSTDIPHMGLPYNFKQLSFSNGAAIANGASTTDTKTATNWGAGKDYYVMSMKIHVAIPAAAFVKFYSGFRIRVWENNDNDNPEIFDRDFNPLKDHVLRTSATAAGNFYLTVPLNKNKVDKDSTLTVDMRNDTGQQLAGGAFDIRIVGMAVAE